MWFVSILAEQLAPSWSITRRSAALEFADRVILAFVTAESVAPGMGVVASLLRREGGAVRVEWWAPTEDGTALRLEAADGRSTASCRTAVPLGPAGALVVVGAGWARSDCRREGLRRSCGAAGRTSSPRTAAAARRNEAPRTTRRCRA